MSQQELLKHVANTLTAAGIEYMVTGSVASSLHGEPRSTHDIDLVVGMPVEAVKKLMLAFAPPDFYLSESAMMDALRDKSMFNLLSLKDGEKVDFWILTDEPFDRSRFARKRVELVLGMSLSISTPEDTILAKLRWAKLSGGSEKQWNDALRVFELQGRTLDLDYLTHWAKQLDVEDDWRQLQSAAELASTDDDAPSD
jgi:hypothetical protein